MTGKLRQADIPKLEGERLRLHVARMVFGGRPGSERGASWLILSPSDDPESLEEEAHVNPPIEQHGALAEACAAFNRIMDEHEKMQAKAPPSRSPAGAGRCRQPSAGPSASGLNL